MIENVLRIFRNILQFYVLLPVNILHGFAVQNVVYENKIAAYVEDSVITTQQIEQEAIRSKVSREKALDILSEEIIIVKAFDRMGGQLPESYVQKKYDNLSSDPNFEDTLRGTGKTKRTFKNELRKNAIVEFMYGRNVAIPNVVSPRDIQNYYDAHKSEMKQEQRINLDQIAVKKDNQEFIEKIKNRIKNGGDYEMIFKHLSEFPGVFANRNDDLPMGDILPEVAQKVETMALNFFSDEGIEIGDYIMFLGLRKIEKEHPLTLVEASGRIERILLNERYQCLRREWLDGLRKKAYYIAL